MDKKTIPTLIVIFGITGNSAIAVPITDNSLISILQYDFVNPTFSENSTNTSFSNTFNSTADIQAFGDASTGKVGSRVIGSDGSSSQSIVSIFDTLNFNTGSANPVEVFFDLTYEGMLASSSIFNNPRSDSTVRIYDITDIDSWLESTSVFGLFDQTSAVDTAALVTFERISFNLDGLTRDGSLQEFNSSVSGSFMADPFVTYGISISSNSFAEDGAVSDFLGTSAFQFTNLNGATFTSNSGEFLSQVSTVPVPTSIWLFGSGLLTLIGFVRNRNKNT